MEVGDKERARGFEMLHVEELALRSAAFEAEPFTAPLTPFARNRHRESVACLEDRFQRRGVDR